MKARPSDPRIARRRRKSGNKLGATLSFSLLDNAYRFLNQSIRHSSRAVRNNHEWLFAIFNVTQAIELMLKFALHSAHPALIYEDIDNPRRTVSLRQALTRLETHAGVSVEQKEKHMINKAAEYRNSLLHSEVTMNRFELRNLYVQLFEFAHFFHARHVKNELHIHVERSLWHSEARLMRYFKKAFVTFDGVEVASWHPDTMLRAQRVTHFQIGLRKYARIRYGSETDRWSGERCHDCAVLIGQYHTDRCDGEECPRCHRQLFSCGCINPDFFGTARLAAEAKGSRPHAAGKRGDRAG